MVSKKYFSKLSLDGLSEIQPRLITDLMFFLFGVFSVPVLIFSFILLPIEWFYNFFSDYRLFVGLLLAVTIGLFFVNLLDFIRKIINSSRFDVILAYFTGVIFIYFSWLRSRSDLIDQFRSSFVNQQLFSYWQHINSDFLNWVVIFFIFSFSLIIFYLFARFLSKKNNNKSLLLSDDAIEGSDDDSFGANNSVPSFANGVINNFAPESLVFGIDAPWGSGKSSYINLCKGYWKKHYKNDVIIYNFCPLSFESEANLFVKFVNGLVSVINKDHFSPEIGSFLKRYLYSIDGFKIRFYFFEFNFGCRGDNVEELVDSIRKELKFLRGKKIIVIVDDLDRLPLEEIKNVLKIVKKSFALPNISYILCYDTENINTFEEILRQTNYKVDLSSNDNSSLNYPVNAKATESLDHSKVMEFFEKIVNVKKTLFVNRNQLIKYVDDNFNKISTNEEKAQFLNSFKDLLGPKYYHKYQPYLGDIRKIKRFLNIASLLDVLRINEEVQDYNWKDLIHLLIIYINYPHIFQKIYITETCGSNHFFSLARKTMSDEGRRYVNSEDYLEYIKGLADKEKYLLGLIFSADRFSGEVDEKTLRTSAAFNGYFLGDNEGRNLEEYLNLIVDQKPISYINSYNFYLSKVKNVLNGKTEINAVLEGSDFQKESAESLHMDFFDVLLKNIDDLDYQGATKFIRFLLDNSSLYSILNIATKKGNNKLKIGLRDDSVYFIAKLIDRKGWQDKDGKNFNNDIEYIIEIAEWIFGEKRHRDEGIINKLAAADKGIIGIYDLLLFRLICCEDRRGGLFNISKILYYRQGPLVSGGVIDEMREFSQKCFAIFNERYIGKYNIFKLVDELSEKDILGRFENDTKLVAERMGLDLNGQLDSERNRLVSFIIYQIGADKLGSGITCGHYDPTGKDDKATIKKIINDYLFDFCFNLDKDILNGEYFVRYLLMHFSWVHEYSGSRYIPLLSGFTDALEGNRLLNYWKKNGDKIKSFLKDKDRVIHTPNYTATYKDDLKNLYQLLDDEVKNADAKNIL